MHSSYRNYSPTTVQWNTLTPLESFGRLLLFEGSLSNHEARQNEIRRNPDEEPGEPVHRRGVAELPVAPGPRVEAVLLVLPSGPPRDQGGTQSEDDRHNGDSPFRL